MINLFYYKIGISSIYNDNNISSIVNPSNIENKTKMFSLESSIDEQNKLFKEFNNLWYINSKGDGNCFNNSLFIFSVETNKNDGFMILFNEAQIAYSDNNGLSWTGVQNSTTTIFTINGFDIIWNSAISRWVALGYGTNSIAYSYNGINWTGIGLTVFSSIAYVVAWNGSMWLAGGSGTSGTMNFQGNTIFWQNNGSNITLNVVDALGNSTQIVVPLGQFTFTQP